MKFHLLPKDKEDKEFYQDLILVNAAGIAAIYFAVWYLCN